MKSKEKTVNGFQKLRRLLSQNEEGMEELVYSKLTRGDVWMIPDNVTGFSKKGEHPWIIIKSYRTGRKFVEVSPRTTVYRKRDDGTRGIITPAYVIPELDKEGLLLLSHRIKISVEEFRDFKYLGKLPNEWISKIEEYLQASVKRSRKSNE